MGDDIVRVIVERPRIPDHGARRKGRALPLDHLPAQDGMRRPRVRFWGGKELNEKSGATGRYPAAATSFRALAPYYRLVSIF